MSGWSLAVSIVALLVSFAAVIYTRKQYNLAYQQDQRALALKNPVLDILPTRLTERHWKLEVRLNNRSNERIVLVGLSIPSPEGGYISMTQATPVAGPIVSKIQINSVSKSDFVQRPIEPGETGLWNAEYHIADAFASPPRVALTMNATIKFLGSEERTATVSVTRELN